MSLSKVGLPGVRTGIVIASESIVRGLAGINAIVNLTTGGFGEALTVDMIESGEIITLSNDVIRPFYLDKAMRAVEWVRRELDGCPYAIHRPEGAIFLWLWFPDLPISSAELYERLKGRGRADHSGSLLLSRARRRLAASPRVHPPHLLPARRRGRAGHPHHRRGGEAGLCR